MKSTIPTDGDAREIHGGEGKAQFMVDGPSATMSSGREATGAWDAGKVVNRGGVRSWF